MALPDWVKGPLELLLTVALLFFVAMIFLNLFVPGVWFSVALGYSMCTERYPYMDFTSLKETRCSIIPGDVLIYSYDPPQVGDVVCVADPRGIVCHRAYEVNATHVCIIGDAARWTGCYRLSDQYYGKVITKLPRAVSMPGVILWGLFRGEPNVLKLIDMGSYELAGK